MTPITTCAGHAGSERLPLVRVPGPDVARRDADVRERVTPFPDVRGSAMRRERLARLPDLEDAYDVGLEHVAGERIGPATGFLPGLPEHARHMRPRHLEPALGQNDLACDDDHVSAPLYLRRARPPRVSGRI